MVSLNRTVTPAQAGKALKVANVDRANGNRGRIQPVSGAKEPSVDVKLCLVFPREALSVPVRRHMLGDALRGLGADDDELAELLLAGTEACTNVVRHGGPGRR